MDKFFQKVDKLNSGQLLVKGVTKAITGNNVNTFNFTTPVGRGDGVAFRIRFVSLFGTAFQSVKFSVTINGKVVNESLPIGAFADGMDPNEELITGSTRIVKTNMPIPEGATVQVKVLLTFTVGDAQMIFDTYFTDVFIPKGLPFIYTEAFQLIAISGTTTKEEFVVPAARGTVAGIALFTDAAPAQFENANSTASVSMNGTNILEDINPSAYMRVEQSKYENNWGVNIKGGSILEISLTNTISSSLNFYVLLYFTDRIN